MPNCTIIKSDFHSGGGSLWENGNGFKQAGRSVFEGEVIAVRVDTANWEIKWTVGE